MDREHAGAGLDQMFGWFGKNQFQVIDLSRRRRSCRRLNLPRANQLALHGPRLFTQRSLNIRFQRVNDEAVGI